MADLHCNVSLHHLFERPLPFRYQDGLSRPGDWQVIDYMCPKCDTAKAELDPARTVLFISAYMMNHPFGCWTHARKQLRKLIPLPFLRDRIVATRAMVGMHVRTVFDAPRSAETSKHATAQKAIELATKEYGSETVETLLKHRESCNWRTFLGKANELVTQDNSTRFYVAADTREAYQELIAALPGRVVTSGRLEEDCTDIRCDARGKGAIVRAFVDMLNVGSTRLILGSKWSSFSVVAASIAPGAPAGGTPMLLAPLFVSSRELRCAQVSQTVLKP